MSNNYYVFEDANEFVPGTKVRSDDMNRELNAIQAAFDLLPGASAALTRQIASLATESQGATVNDYTVTLPDTRLSNQEGDEVVFRATHTNTGAATLAVDGITAVPLRAIDGSAFTGGELVNGLLYIARYDNTNSRFVLTHADSGYTARLNSRVSWAQEWATAVEDTPVSTAAGGDGSTTFSSLHWAAKSAASAAAAAASATAAASAEAGSLTVFYRGTHDASGDTAPATPSGAARDVYLISAAGTFDSNAWEVGDFAIWDGANWNRLNASVATLQKGAWAFESTVSVAGTTTLAGATATSLSVGGSPVVVQTRDLIAGAGLTGGGTLAANRTFNVGEGNGISVAADAVAIDSAWVNAQSWSFTGNISVGGTFGVTGATTLTGDLIVDTDTLFVDVSTDRVGINTATPSDALHVLGETRLDSVSTGVPLKLIGRTGGDNSAFIDWYANDETTRLARVGAAGDSLRFFVDDPLIEAMRIDVNGNVGIGTTAPLRDLDVRGSAAVAVSGAYTVAPTALNAAANGLQIDAGFDTGISITVPNGGNGTLAFGDVADPDIGFIRYAHVDNSFRFNTNAAERMRITSDGNVGIGVTSPNNTLQIHTNATTSLLQVTNSVSGSAATDGLLIGVTTDGSSYIRNRENTALGFWTNDTERMRLDSSGRLGIGTTNPLNELDVNGDIRFGDSSAGVLLDRTGKERFVAFSPGATDIRGDGATGDVRLRYGASDTIGLFLDGGNGRVGIGTSSPGFELEVAESVSPRITINDTGGSATDVNAAVLFNYGGTNAGYVGYNGNANLFLDNQLATGRILLRTDDTTRVLIDENGNVGIGTTSPVDQLTLGADGNLVFDNSSETSANQQYIYFANSWSTRKAYIGADYIASASGNGTSLIFGTNPNSGDAVERMRIDENGNVGIGTTTPDGSLDVVGDTSHFESSNGETLHLIGRSPDNTAQIWFFDNDRTTATSRIIGGTADELRFYVDTSQEVLTLKPNGGVEFPALNTAVTPALIGSTDGYLVIDGGEMKLMQRQNSGVIQGSTTAAQTFDSADVGTHQILTGSTNRTWTMPTGIGQNGSMIILTAADTAEITVAGSGVTITSADGLTTVRAGGTAVLIRFSSTEWFLAGDLG